MSTLQRFHCRTPCTKLTYSLRCLLWASAGSQDLDWTLSMIQLVDISAFSYLMSARTLLASLRKTQSTLRRIPSRRIGFSPNWSRFFRDIDWFRCSSKTVVVLPICPIFRVGHNIVPLLSYRPWLCPFTLANPSVKLSARREEYLSRDVYYRTREIFDFVVLLLLRASSTKFNFSLPHRNQHSIIGIKVGLQHTGPTKADRSSAQHKTNSAVQAIGPVS